MGSLKELPSGIKLQHEIIETSTGLKSIRVKAIDANGRTVGYMGATQSVKGKNAKPTSDMTAHMVSVNPEYQRQGIATQMYKYAENQAGLKLKPDTGAQSKEGAALWKQEDRPFGKQAKPGKLSYADGGQVDSQNLPEQPDMVNYKLPEQPQNDRYNLLSPEGI